MSTPDKQYVALAGKPDGEVWLVDYRKPEGQTHRLLRAAGDLTMLCHDFGDIQPPAGWHDALKISGVVNANLTADTVLGGSEDVVDINHSTNIVLSIRLAQPIGRYLATIKGGSTDISLVIGVVVGHGRETDIDLGNWSDQSQKRTERVMLYLPYNVTGVRVRAINATKPFMLPPESFEYNGWLRHWFPLVQRVGKALGVM